MRIIKSTLPRYSSTLREMGKSAEAIKEMDYYIDIYGNEVVSSALCTSLAGAYLDELDVEKARKYANRAKAMSGGESPQELINVYMRIKSMEA